MKTTKDNRDHLRIAYKADPRVLNTLDDFDALYEMWDRCLKEKAELERQLTRANEMRRGAETKAEELRGLWMKTETLLTAALAKSGLAFVAPKEEGEA